MKTIIVAIVIQDYCGYRGDPEAAFTDMALAEGYKRQHVVPSDVQLIEVPIDPKGRSEKDKMTSRNARQSAKRWVGKMHQKRGRHWFNRLWCMQEDTKSFERGLIRAFMTGYRMAKGDNPCQSKS